MAVTCAIGDLHGRSDVLDAVVSTLRARFPGGGTFQSVGDLIDRGPDSKGVIERFMDPPPGWTFRAVAGNHERMMLDAVEGVAPLTWVRCGGEATLDSYGPAVEPKHLPADHVAFVRSLPLHREDAHRLYVHAGVDPALPVHLQTEKTLTWSVMPDDLPDPYDGHYVVHGHIAHAYGPKVGTNVANLDVMTWHTGRIVVAVFDDDVPGPPVDLVEVVV